jgi:hypothetical protein
LEVSSVIWGPGSGEVHGYLNVVIGGVRCIGRVVLLPQLSPLLLLASLVLVRWSLVPVLWLELISVLEGVLGTVVSGDPSSRSYGFDHLLCFGELDCFVFVVIVCCGEWWADDLVKDAWC